MSDWGPRRTAKRRTARKACSLPETWISMPPKRWLPQASVVPSKVTTARRFLSRHNCEILFMHADAGKESKFSELELAPGTYDVAVVSPGAAALKRLTATGAKVSGNTLEIDAGQRAELSVVIPRGTSGISGVALKDGKPIDGVLVILVPEVPERNLVLFRRDQSDSDGSFNLNGILPGKYTLVAVENAWEVEWFKPGIIQKYLAGGQEVRVTPESKQTVNVNVQP